jgi:RNA polymerase sigma-70 factor (ECF subfamily)
VVGRGLLRHGAKVTGRAGGPNRTAPAAAKHRIGRAPYAAGVSDDDLVRRLRAGDESAFAEAVNTYHSSMVRLAQTFVSSRAVAEEVAQDTWLAVLKGIDHFEGRSSLKTWIFRILANRARSTGVHEQRTTPVDLTDEATVDSRRFDAVGAWSDPPAHWSDEVVDRLSSGPLVAQVRAGISELPEGQRAVVTLRDLDGLSSKDVCDVLGISQANQRVLLHRGRSRIRALLELELAKR